MSGVPAGDEASLRAILRAARSAIHRSQSRSRAAFLSDTDACNSVLYRLERIQDHGLCVSDFTRSLHMEVPWSKLDTLRERTRRVVDTGGITALDQGILWEIVRNELPLVVRLLEGILA